MQNTEKWEYLYWKTEEQLRGTDTVMLESDDNYNKYGNYY